MFSLQARQNEVVGPDVGTVEVNHNESQFSANVPNKGGEGPRQIASGGLGGWGVESHTAKSGGRNEISKSSRAL